MTKYLTVVAALLCVSQLHAADLTRDDVVGKWLCPTKYESVYTLTLDAYEYFADGKSKSSGIVRTFTGTDAVLTFAVQSSGTWSFDKGILTETRITQSVEPRHNEKTQAVLAQSKELAQFADDWQKALSDNSGSEAERTVKLQWTRDEVDSNKIFVRQIDGTGGEGFCYRVKPS
ncbi:MAG: hypothetical protein Q4B82_01310 [Alysiella sp.]|uniref:hypothetical protein n=1 Tax=Alysiella sp. TaxID=1872483 RepID=UPI0026DD7433|nr:hypothetical protein [Alysiella sp.]MDO4433205.1 hypothetical protein [Alysiella sp.]